MTELQVVACAVNVVAGAIGIALGVPLVKRKVRMNGLYGVRFPRSFESDELWYAINEYGGRRLVQWSVVLVAVGLAAPFVTSETWLKALTLAPLLFVVSAVDAYLYSRRA